MKLLQCCPLILNKKFGGAKVYMEMAEAYKRIGIDCTIIGPDNLDEKIKITDLSMEDKLLQYPEVLKKYLIKNSAHYDIVEYEHEFLPFNRDLFSEKTLMVARSILLVQHLQSITIPRPKTLRSFLGNILNGTKRKDFLKKRIKQADLTFKNADFINVTNPDDKKQLINCGHQEDKIHTFPYGISAERLENFSSTTDALPEKKRIAFVGSFDYRKGALEFPLIVDEVLKKIPDIEFILLGTKALFPDEASVRNFFPEKHQKNLIIHPHFNPSDLPDFLNNVSIGMFPSHVESFGFGVLEMLAAHIPVVAYDVPGPPLMLEENMLVPRGNAIAMAKQLVNLLDNQELLQSERKKARKTAMSNRFNWDIIAKDTINSYQNAINKRF